MRRRMTGFCSCDRVWCFCCCRLLFSVVVNEMLEGLKTLARTLPLVQGNTRKHIGLPANLVH